jgi:hypothetical protein
MSSEEPIPLPPPSAQPPPMPLQYQTPATHWAVGEPGTPCPKCGCPYSAKVNFTWWGGVLGPRMFHHVKCRQCGAGFNSKTGRSNNTAIAVYMLVTLGICIAFVGWRILSP